MIGTRVMIMIGTHQSVRGSVTGSWDGPEEVAWMQMSLSRA